MNNSFLVKKDEKRDIYTVSEILSFIDGLELINIGGSNSEFSKENLYNLPLDETGIIFVGKALCSTARISVVFSKKMNGYVVTIPKMATVIDWYLGLKLISIMSEENTRVIVSSHGDVYNCFDIGSFNYIDEINEFLDEFKACGKEKILCGLDSNVEITREMLGRIASHGRNQAIFYSILCMKEQNLALAS